jgi:hypothetical protein
VPYLYVRDATLLLERSLDRELTTDPSRTQARLDRAPRIRLEIVDRLPFLIENRRSEPAHVVIPRQLEEHEDQLYER